MDKWKYSDQRGLTLIGVLTSLLLLGTAAIAISQLMARTEHTVSNSREKFIAANLAREGLELVQAYRDSNWLAAEDRDWIQDICGPADTHTFTIEFNPEAQDTRIYITTISGPASAQLYRTSQGRWTHIATRNTTPYRRALTLDCQAQAGDPAFVVVSADVSWERGGQTQHVIVKQQLYNWYKKPA